MGSDGTSGLGSDLISGFGSVFFSGFVASLADCLAEGFEREPFFPVPLELELVEELLDE